jgi:hypothetical protein
MKYRTRIYYSEGQKALMWESWRKGESLQHIAQLFDRNHSSIQGILAETGGAGTAMSFQMESFRHNQPRRYGRGAGGQRARHLRHGGEVSVHVWHVFVVHPLCRQ